MFLGGKKLEQNYTSKRLPLKGKMRGKGKKMAVLDNSILDSWKAFLEGRKI